MPRVSVCALLATILCADGAIESARGAGVHAMRPRLQDRAAARPLLLAAEFSSHARSGYGRFSLLLNTDVRGRDQRQPWVRAVASVHPVWRLAAAILVMLLYQIFWMLQSLRAGQCGNALRLATLVVCRALVQGVVVCSAMVVITAAAAYARVRGAREEIKDRELTEELLTAAASAAAYEAPHARLRELRERGVESANWRLDRCLSTENVAVFYNSHRQLLLVAFRGTLTRADWLSNLREILPGRHERPPFPHMSHPVSPHMSEMHSFLSRENREESSPSFRRALDVTRRAQRKYMLYERTLLTGHSRGGSMADFVGRKLALPSLQINPGTWGKVLSAEEPAVASITERTADLISLVEAIPGLNGDRQVRLRGPRTGQHVLIGLCVLAVCCLAIAAWDPLIDSIQLAGAFGLVVVGAYYVVWMHSVLRFTKR